MPGGGAHLGGRGSSWTENGRKELSSSSFTLSLLPVGLLVPHFLPLLLLPSAQAGFPPKKGKRQAAKRGQFFLGRGDEGTLSIRAFFFVGQAETGEGKQTPGEVELASQGNAFGLGGRTDGE